MKPKVTIIIPTKNNYEYLDRLITSIVKFTDYTNYEVVVADTGSSPQMLENMKFLIQPYMNINMVRYDYYNFSEINNDVVDTLDILPSTKNTDLLVFCNDDIEFNSDVISTFVNYWIKHEKNIGTLGARLHFDDGKVQHSGVYLLKDSKGGVLGLSHYGYGTYLYHEEETDVLGNTAALMMIEKRLFKNLGGFNEEYDECFEDVELNLKCLFTGRRNVFLPDAVALHSESTTRNKDKEKGVRERNDYQRLLEFMIKNKNNKYFNDFL